MIFSRLSVFSCLEKLVNCLVYELFIVVGFWRTKIWRERSFWWLWSLHQSLWVKMLLTSRAAKCEPHELLWNSSALFGLLMKQRRSSSPLSSFLSDLCRACGDKSNRIKARVEFRKCRFDTKQDASISSDTEKPSIRAGHFCVSRACKKLHMIKLNLSNQTLNTFIISNGKSSRQCKRAHQSCRFFFS